MYKRIGVGLLLLGAVSCATTQHGSGEIGGGSWIEVKSRHFDVRTDESLENAEEIAHYLERSRAAILAAVWPKAKISAHRPVNVVVLADGLAFKSLFSDHVDGLFIGSRDTGFIALYGNPDHWEKRRTLSVESSTSVLKHEMVHRLAALVGIRQPRWLAEGLAQFLETLKIAPDGKSAEVGLVNLDGLRMYQRNRVVGVADALDWHGPIDQYGQGGTAARYGLSWAMVHWLYNTHPAQFANYQLALVQGKSPQEAWTLALPKLPPSEADRAIHQYLKTGKYEVFTVKLPAFHEGTLSHRALSVAETHALAASLELAAIAVRPESKKERIALARKELAAASRADANALPVLKQAFALSKGTAREAVARRAVKAHPENAFSWIMLAESLGEVDSPEKESALLRAAKLDPGDPTPLNALAWARVTHGKASAAFPYALKAHLLAPTDPMILDTYAATLAGVGRCDEAVSTETRAIGLLSEHTSAQAVAEFESRLARFRTQCGAKKSPAGAASSPAK